MSSKENSKKRTLVVALIAVLLIIGLGGGGWFWYYSSRYITTDDARISGTIVSVSSKISGKVGEVLVAEGDKVKKGQVLVRLNPEDILAQRAQAEAALLAAKAKYDEVTTGARPQEISQSKAGVGQAQANLENAEKNYRRLEKLYNDGVVSAAQRDNALAAYQVAQESCNAANQSLSLTVSGPREEIIRAAEAQVKQAEANLAAIDIKNGDTQIVAPVDGIVALKNVNVGEVVAAGQALFSVVSDIDLWVNARLEETYIGKVQLGQEVEYTIDGYPGQSFSGKVSEIGSAASSVFALVPTENSSNNFTKVTQRIPIKITLPEESSVIFRPGMSVYVKIHVK
ncbi:MAG: emrA 2 [Firmicutes bacterium]|nr:emrA 2 [Bacillota bacterium]